MPTRSSVQRRLNGQKPPSDCDASCQLTADDWANRLTKRSRRFSCAQPWLGVGHAIRPLAAILHQISKQAVHRCVVGAVDQGAMLPLLHDQPGTSELRQVKGKRTIGKAKRLRDCTGSHPVVAGANKQSKYREAMFLGKGSERADCCLRLHQRKPAQWISPAQQAAAGRADKEVKIDANILTIALM
jgi:hypothetical protein